MPQRAHSWRTAVVAYEGSMLAVMRVVVVVGVIDLTSCTGGYDDGGDGVVGDAVG